MKFAFTGIAPPAGVAIDGSRIVIDHAQLAETVAESALCPLGWSIRLDGSTAPRLVTSTAQLTEFPAWDQL
jgi:hypothetical protein